ncbi:MAG: sulfatase [Thermoanaerobaculia bacterium]
MLLGGTVGCSPSQPGGRTPQNWLFAGTPGELVDPADRTPSQSAALMEFRHGSVLPPGWKIEGGSDTASGRCLAPQGGSIELDGPASAAMAGAARLQIEVQGLMLMPIVLGWNEPIEGAPPAARRFWADALGPTRSRVVYELATVARERREGDRVRLRFLAEADREFCLVDVRAVGDRNGPPESQGAEALATTPVRLDLDGEVRSALLSRPGSAIEIPVPAEWSQPGSPAASLRLGFGRAGTADSPFVFRVVLLAGGLRRELLAERWEKDAPEGWRDREIEMTGLPADSRLSLESEIEGEPGSAVSAWSNVTAVPRVPDASRRPRMNVVLISIDTLRADRLSIYGAERPTSPGLDAWARRRATVFENAIAQAPWTLPSHASMLSGLDTFHHAAIFAKPVPAGVTFLQERLAAAGYRTRAVTGAAYLDPRYGFSRGFERYRHWQASASGSEIEHGVEWAKRYIGELGDEPFFLFFHTYEVHGPLRAHQPYFSRFSALPSDQFVVASPTPERAPGARENKHVMVMFPPGRRELQVPLPPALAHLPLDLYDSGVASAAAQISRLLDFLEAKGLSERTLVVVTADHGEALGEHSVGGHGFLYDDNLRVPLMISLPGVSGGGRRVPDQVRSIDIVPTILDLAGLAAPPGLDGKSLSPLLAGRSESEGREAWTYSGALGVSLRLTNGAKFLFWDGVVPGRSMLDRFFDLRHDPAELHDILPALAARGRLESRVLARVRAQAGGLRIGLPVSAAAGRELRLEAPWLDMEVAKWTATPIDEVRWPGPHRLAIPLPSGRSSELLVLTLAPPVEELAVELFANGELVRGAVDPSRAIRPGKKLLGFRAGSRLIFAEDIPPGAEPQPVVTFEWVGAIREDSVDPAKEDAELRKDLEALGYLN